MSPYHSLTTFFLLLPFLFLFCPCNADKYDRSHFKIQDSGSKDWRLLKDRVARSMESTVTATVINHPYDENGGKTQSLQEVSTYSVLKSDPKSSLPSSFTVCSATRNVETYYKDDYQLFFIILGPDGSHFLQARIYSEDIDTRMSSIYLGLQGIFSKLEKKIPIVFAHQWTRGCMAVNTQSGRIQFVVDGHLVEDKVYEGMVGSTGNSPTNMTGRILLGAYWTNGYWVIDT